MEYEPEFAKSFIRRTLEILEEYKGQYDATLLINCLLGLLVLPKETLLEKIPETPAISFSEWGINPGSIKNTGKCNYGHQHQLNPRQLTHRLRNAVAHFKVEPFPKKGEVQGFTFKDNHGFHAELTLEEIKAFVVKLSEYLRDKT